MGLPCTVSEIDGDLRRKYFHPLYFAPLLKGFPLELGISAWVQKKTRMMGLPGREKFDDIFSHLDTIHQRDGQTDGRTPGDSKDRAYA